MKQINQSCKNCRFWKALDDEPEIFKTGHCRRYPPAKPRCGSDDCHELYPAYVSADYWCGEWQQHEQFRNTTE